jgi:DNA polymerase-3 subunit alpha/DNA polymerase-3 subunit epsilon
MNFLFFDVETNGLPKDYKASYTDVDNWPRVIQLAWILADENAQILHQHAALVKPDGWIIPREKFWIDNGHSTERNEAEGVPISSILDLFMEVKGQADVLVAHNLNFDHRIVWAEIIRSGRQPRSGMHKICTMMSSTKYCKIPQANGKGLKWPQLPELHQVLFGCGFEGAHDAMADITATAKCFYELVVRGVIVLPSQPTPQSAAHA